MSHETMFVLKDTWLERPEFEDSPRSTFDAPRCTPGITLSHSPCDGEDGWIEMAYHLSQYTAYPPYILWLE